MQCVLSSKSEAHLVRLGSATASTALPKSSPVEGYVISQEEFDSIVALKNEKDETDKQLAAAESEILRLKEDVSAAKKSFIEERRELQKEAFSLRDKADEASLQLKNLQTEHAKVLIKLNEKCAEIKPLKNECETLSQSLELAKTEILSQKGHIRAQEDRIRKLQHELETISHRRNAKQVLECVCKQHPPGNLSSECASMPSAMVDQTMSTNSYLRLRETILSNRIQRLQFELDASTSEKSQLIKALEVQQRELRRLEDVVQEFTNGEKEKHSRLLLHLHESTTLSDAKIS
jgi:chromosome segregation ATPase